MSLSYRRPSLIEKINKMSQDVAQWQSAYLPSKMPWAHPQHSNIQKALGSFLF